MSAYHTMYMDNSDGDDGNGTVCYMHTRMAISLVVYWKICFWKNMHVAHIYSNSDMMIIDSCPVQYINL